MRLKSMRWGWGPRCAIGVLVLAVVVPAPASAQLVLRSFSDGASTSKSELTDLATQLRSGCTPKVLAVRSMSLATALAPCSEPAEPQLERQGTEGVCAQQGRKDGGQRSQRGVRRDRRRQAVGGDRRRAASSEARWKRRGPLLSVAGLVSPQGMPQEALALLNAATKRKPKAKSPMGIGIQAVASNNRGYALLLLGHPKQAMGD